MYVKQISRRFISRSSAGMTCLYSTVLFAAVKVYRSPGPRSQILAFWSTIGRGSWKECCGAWFSTAITDLCLGRELSKSSGLHQHMCSYSADAEGARIFV